MSSEVSICNLALSHLGDTATIASLNPPEGSAQAEHCAIFYPVARDAMLEYHAWSFATRRTPLSVLAVDAWGWSYAYAAPSGAVNLLAVLPPSGNSDEPQPFEVEASAGGARVVLTNQERAVMRYTIRETDVSQFSPLFTLALSWQLASMLAGPILKGDAGAAESKRCASVAMAYIARAAASDANQRHNQPPHNVGWIAAR